MSDVLLIEDDDMQRAVAGLALRKAGHAVREVADGPEGLASARDLEPDVIVCDVMMPGMSGYELLAELRQDPDLATVPVILLTAMSDRQDMRKGMTAGADDYLTKPYRPEELCEAVETVLARRQVQEQAFRSSLTGMVESALEQQKETLGRQYEGHLQREINARWDSAQAATDLQYPDALVLMADLLAGAAGEDEAGLAARVKQAQQAARDTLYLFGAAQVLPYGARLLAIFPRDQQKVGTPAHLRALRAALALSTAAGRDRPVTVALHTGPMALVALHDGLHGNQGHALVPGETVHATAALDDFAAAQGWRIAASEAVAALLQDELAPGRQGTTARGDLAVEVVGAAPA
jgi:DNA-binding response OmpR family regulator